MTRMTRRAGIACVLLGSLLVLHAQAGTLREALVQGALRRSLERNGAPVHVGSMALRPAVRIGIPSLGLDVVVPEAAPDATEMERVLSVSPVAWRPRWDGPLVVSGHRDSHFASLGRLREGDALRVTDFGGTRSLVVTEARVVAPGDVSLLADLDGDAVVLSTCYPFDHLGPAPSRWVIVGKELSAGG
jgi:sortase A